MKQLHGIQESMKTGFPELVLLITRINMIWKKNWADSFQFVTYGYEEYHIIILDHFSLRAIINDVKRIRSFTYMLKKSFKSTKIIQLHKTLAWIGAYSIDGMREICKAYYVVQNIFGHKLKQKYQQENTQNILKIPVWPII